MRVRPLGRRGQSAVEFALIVTFFFAVFFAIFDMVRLCYDWAALQYAVNEGARFGSLGNTSEAISTRVNQIAQNLWIDAPTVQVLNPTDGQAITGLGTSSSFFRLTASNQVILSPVSEVMLNMMGRRDSTVTITAETLIRYEPF